MGFSVHLTKPVDVDQLDREIQLLGEKMPERSGSQEQAVAAASMASNSSAAPE